MTMAMSTAVRKKGMVEDSAMTDGLKIISRKKSTVAETAKLRAAAYCRVSTELEIQESSIELQMEAFEKTISEHPEWEIVEIYSDRGKTGTMVKGRSGFLRMIEDAKAGKIDLILTKSVSRVARNTRDMLEYTRMMRDIGVGFYFDEENINTLSMTSELLLTVYAAFNQEESHEICGMPMTRRTITYQGKQQKVWKCKGRLKDCKSCKNDVISEEDLFKALSEHLGIKWKGVEAVTEKTFAQIKKVVLFNDGRIEIEMAEAA